MSKIWGRGRFRHLTDKLRDPRALRFSKALQGACGCQLAYHRGRDAYVAFRDRGGFTYPQIYCDVGKKGIPPHLSMLREVIEAIRWANARQAADIDRMFSIMQRRMEAASTEDTCRFIDEWLPDYYRDLKRTYEVLTDGRVSTKYFDLTAGRRAGAQPTLA